MDEMKIGIRTFEFNGIGYSMKIAVDRRGRIQRVFQFFDREEGSYTTKSVSWCYHHTCSIPTIYIIKAAYDGNKNCVFDRIHEIKWDEQNILLIKGFKENNFRLFKWKSVERLIHTHTYYEDFGDGTYNIPIWKLPSGETPRIDLTIKKEYANVKLAYLGQEIEFKMPKPKKVSKKIIMNFLYKLFFYLPYADNVFVYERGI